MLSELNIVGGWFNNQKRDSWKFDELKFDCEAKGVIESLALDIEVFDHSARVDISQNGNLCYIPSHYFLYALKIKPLTLLLSRYMEVFDEVVASVGTAVEFDRMIQASSPSNNVLNALDPYSRDNFIKVFKNKSDRLNGKDIVNSDERQGKKFRNNDDFVNSIVLKALPVPDTSSSILGDLVYAFSQNPNSYQALVDKYSSYIPSLFSSTSGDDLLLMILSTLGWQGELDTLLVSSSGRMKDWGDFQDAFLMSPTPVSGNNLYLETPIHYSTSLGEYVHLKKGLLVTPNSLKTVSDLISDLWPNMAIDKLGLTFSFKNSGRIKITGPVFKGASNKIYYGAPGTGKSYQIHNEECKGAEKIVTVFHPDTQYNDFVGALKPKIEKDASGKSIVTYQFRPGPFTDALVKAKIHPEKHVYLVIEEINRAPAAAVFGELFQLLDRSESGESAYEIDAADPDMLMYINEQLRTAGRAELTELNIPANLSLLATMNSSDQAVMPLDTAFKRRWSFEYLDIDFSHAEAPQTDVPINAGDGLVKIKWPKLAVIINEVLVENGVAEDRLVGPFFLSKKELNTPDSAKEALKGKLFVYLWDDVLRHLGHSKLFSSTYKTFGRLSNAFNNDEAVFNSEIEERIKAEASQVATD